MKQCWKDYGLSELGAKQAENLIEEMMCLADKADTAEMAKILLQEALLRVYELPARANAQQEE